MSESIFLEKARIELDRIIKSHGWQEIDVSVHVKSLTPEEAIGNPTRRDYPIIEGKERVIQAEVFGITAHAFTDSPKEFSGKLGDVANLPMESNGERAIFIGTLNAVLKYLGLIEKTLHCRDEEPEQCAKEIAASISSTHGMIRVGLIGLNPAIAESLVKTFGVENVKITDLNRDNMGTRKFGVEIWDGRTQTGDMVKACDLILMTGTTLVNGTFDGIYELIKGYDKEYLIYGVTASGVNKLFGFHGICPYGRA